MTVTHYYTQMKKRGVFLWLKIKSHFCLFSCGINTWGGLCRVLLKEIQSLSQSFLIAVSGELFFTFKTPVKGEQNKHQYIYIYKTSIMPFMSFTYTKRAYTSTFSKFGVRKNLMFLKKISLLFFLKHLSRHIYLIKNTVTFKITVFYFNRF